LPQAKLRKQLPQCGDCSDSLLANAPEAMPINAGALLQKSRERRVPADSRPVSSESAPKQVLGLLPLGIASGAKVTKKDKKQEIKDKASERQPYLLSVVFYLFTWKGALRGLAPVEGVAEDCVSGLETGGDFPLLI
jgi:hypothetical protein